ncbi:hypothetical protein [Micromonospora sp. NPDC000668]|uniref:hypothetical protein n=1 Tax=Micromonospora sp. NPDC000668 TaxID=3364219 RepID=UPI0036BD7ECA
MSAHWIMALGGHGTRCGNVDAPEHMRAELATPRPDGSEQVVTPKQQVGRW